MGALAYDAFRVEARLTPKVRISTRTSPDLTWVRAGQT